MTLLQFEIPPDKIQFLKERIQIFKEKSATLQEGEAKDFMTARYKILESFLEFLTKDCTEIELFKLTNKGMTLESAANMEIDMALAQGGSITNINNPVLINAINTKLYNEGDSEVQTAVYYNTCLPNVFQWWQKAEKSVDDEWKGVVKIPTTLLEN